MTLHEYAEIGVDKFALREQFHNWYNSSTQNPIMFLKYEHLFENLKPLIQFCDLPLQILDDFPEKTRRKSVAHLDSQETLELLQKMHREFLSEIEELPDFEIRKPTQYGPIEKISNQMRYTTSSLRYGASDIMKRLNKKFSKVESLIKKH